MHTIVLCSYHKEVVAQELRMPCLKLAAAILIALVAKAVVGRSEQLQKAKEQQTSRLKHHQTQLHARL